ncbi:hypothetical protein N0V83_000733 [Neocucurbitaria cava]|uniref:Uncharacterized protein n=1 Tax=Neocucurbitaria cava TaxID=798079 RepID=A0A9W9CS95_9PLEO|nr:hypothetical protein N0V83_000733 [Neocucurbitaria cava]
MFCPLLSQIQTLPLADITILAEQSLHPAILHTFCRAHGQVITTGNMAPLTELIYYQLGSNLVAQEEWNEMTRLQLEYELILRGLLEISEVRTEWQLRLRLAAAVLMEKKMAENDLQEDVETEGHEDQVENEEEGENMQIEGNDDDDEDDRDWKVIFTKSNGQTMVY